MQQSFMWRPVAYECADSAASAHLRVNPWVIPDEFEGNMVFG